ncbi:DUF2752 domain-containing protein [Eisenbergiella sp.]
MYMKEKAKAVLMRIGKDVKQYKWAAAAFLVYYIVVKRVFHAFCPLLILTGLPCPGCGTTRALLYIFQGQFGRAWRLNPCAFLWVLFGIYLFSRRYVQGKEAKWAMKFLAATAALMILVYVYRMVAEFPGHPPMTFRRDNILNRIFPFYNDLLRRLFGI